MPLIADRAAFLSEGAQRVSSNVTTPPTGSTPGTTQLACVAAFGQNQPTLTRYTLDADSSQRGSETIARYRILTNTQLCAAADDRLCPDWEAKLERFFVTRASVYDHCSVSPALVLASAADRFPQAVRFVARGRASVAGR